MWRQSTIICLIALWLTFTFKCDYLSDAKAKSHCSNILRVNTELIWNGHIQALIGHAKSNFISWILVFKTESRIGSAQLWKMTFGSKFQTIDPNHGSNTMKDQCAEISINLLLNIASNWLNLLPTSHLQTIWLSLFFLYAPLEIT